MQHESVAAVRCGISTNSVNLRALEVCDERNIGVVQFMRASNWTHCPTCNPGPPYQRALVSISAMLTARTTTVSPSATDDVLDGPHLCGAAGRGEEPADAGGSRGGERLDVVQFQDPPDESYARWSDIRAEQVGRAGGEAAVEEGKQELLAQIVGHRSWATGLPRYAGRAASSSSRSPGGWALPRDGCPRSTRARSP
jgi:hypothetical protein